jgi:acetolactate synthase-1/2/3 large subunit
VKNKFQNLPFKRNLQRYTVGAAVACPDRRVINIQADGSGLYSPQALWTQARERLDVVTVVCSNRVYAILKLELAMQRVGAPG